jgi:Na+-driven multidrug efflux pump
MIPIWGIEGSAIATLMTQILANAVYPAFFIRTRSYAIYVFDAFALRDLGIKRAVDMIRYKVKNPIK